MNGYSGDISFDYVFDYEFNADESADTGVKTQTDSDFALLGLIINVYTSILFNLWFRDASGNYFSSAPVMAANYLGQGPIPYTFQGQPRIFPPGSLIGIEAQELSGFENTIQLTFVGIKRFVTPPALCPPAMSHQEGRIR